MNYKEFRSNVISSLPEEEKAIFNEAYNQAGISMYVSQLIYDTRNAANLTQSELALRIGTTQSAIAAIESGRRTPSVDFLGRVAQACGKNLVVSFAAS